jgi:TP901 family phage tail tape measure protein
MASQSDIKLNIVVSVSGQQALNTLASGIARVNAVQARAATAANNTTQAVSRQRTQLTGLAGRLEEAETRYDALYRASYRLQIVGSQLVNGGKDILGMVKMLTDGWGDFEFMVNRAAGALQIWKNVGSSLNPIYTALIDNLQAATKELRLFPADDVAKATYFWASTSGQAVNSLSDLKVVMEAVNPLMKVAALTQTSYETAIKGVYSIIVQYGKGLGDVADVTNKLFLSSQRTALEFPDLINAFKFVGPVAGALGVSFEDVANVLGQIGDAGIRGTMAGRALRQMFIQLERPTAKTTSVLNALFMSTKGINKSFKDVVFPNGKFVGITGFVHALAVALKDADTAQRGLVLASISTANELPVLTALVGNEIKVIKGIPGAYDKAKSSVSNAANAAEQFRRSWELLANSWKGITGRITAGVEVIKLKIGQDIANALRPAVERVTELLDKIEKWVKQNPAIVTALGRLAGIGAAVMALAGFALIATGSLLGLYAAVRVLATGFGRLIAPITGVVGLVTLFGEAILRNWTRITRTLSPAIKRLTDTFRSSNPIIQQIREAWLSAHKTINDFMDFIVRVAVSVLRHFLDMISGVANSNLGKWLAQVSAELVKLVTIAAGVLLALKGLNLIWVVLAGTVKLFLSPLRSMFMGLVQMGDAAVIAGGGLKGLKAALSAISLTGALAIITALVFAVQQLAEMNFLGIGDFFKNLTRGLPEIKNEVKDLLAEMGDAGKGLGPRIADMATAAWGASEKAAQKAADAASNAAEAARVDLTKGFDLLGISTFKAMQAQDALDKVKKSAEEMKKELLEGVVAAADAAGVNVDDFASRVVVGLGKMRLSWYDASKYATDFFGIVKDGTPSVEDAVQLWNKMFSQGLTKGLDPKQFLKDTVSQEDINKYINDINAKILIAEKIGPALQNKDFGVAYGILLQLKNDSSQYSDQINAQVDNLIGGIPETIKGVVEEASNIAVRAPQEIADAIVAGVAKIKDFKTTLKKALAGLMKPQDFVSGLIGDITSADLKSAFTSDKVGAVDLAQGALDGLMTTFADAIASAGEDLGPLQAAVKKAFGPQLITAALGDLHTWKGVKLTPEQTKAIQQMVDTLFPQFAPLPSGSVVTSTASELAKKIPKMLASEFDPKYNRDTVPLPKTGSDAFASIIAGMRTQVEPMKKLASDTQSEISLIMRTSLFSDGFTSAKTYSDGWASGSKYYIMPRLIRTLRSISDYVAGKSPPPKGPLKDIDKGGFNVGQAWATAVGSGAMLAVQQASSAAAQVNRALQLDSDGLSSSMSLDTTNSRKVIVEVQVTSPDGSVGKMDMKTLAGALTGSALTRSLEAAAAAK